MAKLGGKRAGAGRPKGTLNRRNADLTAAMLGAGQLPLEYMLEVMRDPEADPADRRWAAEKSAGFVHPRPAPAARTVTIDLPDTATPEGLVKAADAVLQATARGDIAPEAIMSVLELSRKAIETVEMVARLDRLEAQLERRP